MTKKHAVVAIFILLFSLQVAAQEWNIFSLLKTGSYKQLKRFLAKNPGAINETQNDGRTPLAVAVNLGDLKAVKLLLYYGADPMKIYQVTLKNGEQREMFAFSEAFQFSSCKEEIIKYFVRSGVEINKPYEYYDKHERKMFEHYWIFSVLMSGSPDLLDFFIKQGADLYVRNRWDNTVLDVVSYPMGLEDGEQLERIYLLLQGGADSRGVDDKGRNLIMRLVAVPKKLLSARYKVNLEKCLKFLINEEADLDHQDDEGWTALHSAVWFNNVQAIKLLIEGGAKTDISLKNGETPRDLALKLKRNKMVEILNKAEKRNN